MRPIDQYSYRCGVIDSFNELVAAGIKPIALSHACATAEERAEYLPFSQEITARYGTRYYVEDALLVSDLFPVSACRGQFVLLYYREEADLNAYLALKARKQALVESGQYAGRARAEIAHGFGRLLGYSEEAISRYIAGNPEREEV